MWRCNGGTIVLTSAMLAMSAMAGGCGHSHPALRTHQETGVSAAVRQGLNERASTPGSGISHGTEVVLAPMCVSTTDPRYVAVVAYPIVEHGQVGQAAFVYVRQGRLGYRMLEAFQVGSRQLARPPLMPKRAWSGIGVGRTCIPLSPARILALRKQHALPDFKIH